MNNAIASVANKIGFGVRKHSPELLMAAGIVSGVAATVFACKATIKAQDILAETKDQVEAVHTVMEDETIDEETYSQEDSKKDLAVIYVQTGIKLAKVYAPAIALGALAVTSILASNNIMRKRNVALAAAYTVVDNAFKDYRKGVVERYGEEVDYQIRHHLKAVEVTETVTDEKGKEKKTKKTVYVPSENGVTSGFARIFDAGNSGWENDPAMNLAYLKAQEAFCNKKLQTQGYLFLNDVYRLLGYREDVVSRNVGWIYDEENPVGDNYVDFRFRDSEAFMRGYEPNVVLDFNVDGPIMDRFEKAYRGFAVC